MSLRYQINLRVFLASLGVLFLGSAIAIWQARNSVQNEVESSINLAVQLMNVGFAQASSTNASDAEWLSKFQALKATRHLVIQLQQPSGKLLSVGGQQQSRSEDLPPRWFINLVAGNYAQVEHTLEGSNKQPITVVIAANPLDEITEAWQESLRFVISLVLLSLCIFLAVSLVFAKTLRSIALIVDTLKLIETGSYQQKLPNFAIQEYDQIAKAINHMTAELAQSQAENRALTQHSLLIQEDERQRLAQELHDELGQSLTAIKVMAVAAAHAKADIQLASNNMVAICDHLMTVVRSMMHQLHPLILTELGLKAALEDLLQHWAARNPELTLELDCPEAVDALDKRIIIQVFRVVQECITNVVRHAQAKNAAVSLQLDSTPMGQLLTLQVEDDGRGCALAQLKSGFGLLGIRERIRSLDGEVNISTQPQQGLTLVARIPL